MTEARCQQCGATIGAGARFCMSCGSDVSGEQGGIATRMVGGDPAATPETTGARRISQADLLARLRDATLGDYEILAELGHGGMATVYLAHDIQLDRKVAIKVLNPRVAQDEGMVERFRLEARTAAALSHPHIIPIHAVRETDDVAYFVMKFVVGRALDSIIKELAPLPIPTARTILTKVAEALGYAHRNGVVHRDIKPSNIMIDAEGMPIVTDFGIAKVADRERLTMTGAAIGTPTYMSPEQCNAGTITGASDQYSLGVVAFEMLTGRPLYEGENFVTIMFKHCHEAPPAPEAFGPRVPPDLVRTVIRMLQKAPKDRWPAMEDALAGLRGTDASHDDEARTLMVEYAKGGPNAELLERLSTPRSPINLSARQPHRPPRTPPVAAPTVPTPATTKRRRGGLIAAAGVVVVAAGALAVLQPWRSPDTVPEPSAGQATAPVAVTPPVAASASTIAESTATDTSPVPEPDRAAPSPVAVGGPTPASIAAVRDVQLRSVPAQLAEGERVPLQAVVLDAQGRRVQRVVGWASSDPAVARVDADGTLRAVGPGTAIVTASVDGHQSEAAVTVTAAVATVSLTPARGELGPGESLMLTATVRDRRGNAVDGASVAWRSTNERVAVVSSTGRVTAVGVGAAVISAASGGQVATADIAVAAPAAPARAEPSPAPVENPRDAITGLVQAYAQALESKDLARVRELYPSITPSLQRRTREALEAMEDVSVRLVPTQIAVDGNTATAQVTGEWVYRGGHLPVNNRYVFERRTAGWVIVAIE